MPEVQYIDNVVDVPVVKQRQVPLIKKVQNTVEAPQVQIAEAGSYDPQSSEDYRCSVDPDH